MLWRVANQEGDAQRKDRYEQVRSTIRWSSSARRSALGWRGQGRGRAWVILCTTDISRACFRACFGAIWHHTVVVSDPDDMSAMYQSERENGACENQVRVILSALHVWHCEY